MVVMMVLMMLMMTLLKRRVMILIKEKVRTARCPFYFAPLRGG